MPRLRHRRKRGTESIVVGLLTLAFVLSGTAFAVLTPMFSNFDEQTHLDRARYTSRHPLESVDADLRLTHGSWGAYEALVFEPDEQGDRFSGLPSTRPDFLAFRDYPGGNAQQRTDCPGGLCQNIQYVQPPAWYLLVSPFAALYESRPFPHTVLALRLIDVLLVAPVVALSWLAARNVWPGSPNRRIAVAAFVAFTGPLAYTASNVNNDALLVVLAAAAIAIITRILRYGATVFSAAGLGLIVTAGMLTKVEFVLMAPTAGLAVLVAAGPWRARVRNALAFGVTAAVGSAWWLASLLGEGPLSPEGSELLRPPSDGPWQDETFVSYGLSKVGELFSHTTGLYGLSLTTVPAPINTAIGIVTLLLAVGWLLLRRWRWPSWTGLRWALLGLIPISLTLGVLWASFDTYRENGEPRGIAPRYLYSATPIIAIMVIGAAATILARVLPRLPRRPVLFGAIFAFAAGMLGSYHVAATGGYDTGSWAKVLDRASIVSPLAEPGPSVMATCIGWVVVVGIVLTLSARRGVGSDALADAYDRGPGGS